MTESVLQASLRTRSMPRRLRQGIEPYITLAARLPLWLEPCRSKQVRVSPLWKMLGWHLHPDFPDRTRFWPARDIRDRVVMIGQTARHLWGPDVWADVQRRRVTVPARSRDPDGILGTQVWPGDTTRERVLTDHVLVGVDWREGFPTACNPEEKPVCRM